MMKRFLRRSLVAGGIFLLIFIAVILLAPRLLPGDLITDQVTREVERATGARVTLGEARIHWAWGWSITLRDGSMRGTGAALAEATGSPNGLESYAIQFDEFSIVPALLPLLRKQLVVKAVQLAGPRLVVGWREGEVEATGFRVRISDLNLGLDTATMTAAELNRDGAAPPGDLIPADLVFSFAVTADTLVLQRVPYTHLDMKGGFADKALAVTALSARRSTGTLTGDLSVDFVENPWGRLFFKAEARKIPAVALLKPWAPDIGSRLDCDLDTELVGECDLRDKATVLRTVNIDGWLTGGPGVLHAAEWLRDVTPYLGNRQDLKDVRFKSLVHHFMFNQGRYYLEGLTLTGGDTEWSGKGWLDLEGNIAMGIDVKLPPGFTPDLGNFSFLAQALRDSEGRINLPLKMSGRTARPTFGVDLGRLRAP